MSKKARIKVVGIPRRKKFVRITKEPQMNKKLFLEENYEQKN